MAFKRILVAVDGSKSSEEAADAAIDIAKASGASLFILSVIQNPVLTEAATPGLGAASGAVKQYMNVAKAALESFVDKLESRAKSKGVKVRGEIEENVPSVVQAITEYAEEWEVDLVVVGTRGLSGFKKLLLGSVSSGLVSHSHCSVLVVR